MTSSDSIDVCGIDPGTTYFGYGHIRLKGIIELINTKGEVVKIIPDIDIVSMERWNLKTRQIYCRDPSNNTLSVKLLNNTLEKSLPDELQHWSSALSDSVAQSDHLFETYPSLIGNNPLPVVVTENQCDKNKGEPNEAYKRYEMTVISYVFRASIRAIDSKNNQQRISTFAGKKYNMPSDGTIGNRLARKKRAVEVLKELLFELSLHDWLSWLNTMERLGEQIHDMADAVLLAIQTSLKLADIKKDMTQKRSTLNTPRVSISVRRINAPLTLELAKAIQPVRKERAPVTKKSIVTKKTTTTTLMGKTFIVPLASGNGDEEDNQGKKMIQQQKVKASNKNKRKAVDVVQEEPTTQKKRKYVKKPVDLKRKAVTREEPTTQKKRKYVKKPVDSDENLLNEADLTYPILLFENLID